MILSKLLRTDLALCSVEPDFKLILPFFVIDFLLFDFAKSHQWEGFTPKRVAGDENSNFYDFQAGSPLGCKAQPLTSRGIDEMENFHD